MQRLAVAEPARVAVPAIAAAPERPAPGVAYARWIDACSVAGWRVRTQSECVPVAACAGRVTAKAAVADRPSPWFDRAAMDGIAVSAAAVARQEQDGNASRSGRWQLAAADFVWVDTGEPMPPGTHAVVEAERVRVGADPSAWIVGPAPARGEVIDGDSPMRAHRSPRQAVVR